MRRADRAVGDGRRVFHHGNLLVHVKHTANDIHLGMIAHVVHTVTPDDLAVLEEKLAAVLEKVSHLPAIRRLAPEHFVDGVKDCACSIDFSDVLGTLAQSWGDVHFQCLEELPVRVGVDGKGTIDLVSVLWDEFWVAAADDGNGCRDGKRKVGGSDGVDELADVGLTGL